MWASGRAPRGSSRVRWLLILSTYQPLPVHKEVNMSLLRLPVRVVFGCATAIVCGLGAHSTARAQNGDDWSFVVSSQVWATHVAKDGFVSADSTGGFFVVDPNGYNISPTVTTSSSPVDSLNPQWGLQVAAQKG